MAKSKSESKAKAPVIPVEDETSALKAVEEVKEVKEVKTKSKKADHDCAANARTISVAGRPTKQCRVCGQRL
jgi:hypothetical protein